MRCGMSDQSKDLAELLRDRPRLGTAHGRVESRTRSAAAFAVGQRWDAQLRLFYPPGSYATISPPQGEREPSPAWSPDAIDMRVAHVWIDALDRSRTESRGSDNHPHLLVVGSDKWAEYTPYRGIAQARPRDGLSQALHLPHRETALALLAPWRLLHGYTLHIIGNAEVAGRQGVRYRGLPTSDARAVVDSGGEDEPFVYAGADAAEFVVDTERGVLLRWSGYADGEEYAVTAFTTLTFDQEVDNWLFDPELVPAWGAAQRKAL